METVATVHFAKRLQTADGRGKMKENMINLCLFIWYRVAGAAFRLLPVKRNRVLFENFYGRGYGDNPRYIAEELRQMGGLLELVWLVKNHTYTDIPPEMKQVKRGTFEELYYIATSGIWVDNVRKHYGIRKRRNQFYIQTWHGGLGIKKAEGDVPEILSRSYIKSAVHDSRMTDLLISNSEWFTQFARRAFWYDGEILECGYPRSDVFFGGHREAYSGVRREFDLQADVKIALYAPTFRENGDTRVYMTDFNALCRMLERHWGGTWVALVRLHPNMARLRDRFANPDQALDASGYGDMNRLIAACDLLITDYSSCMFDGMNAGKTVMLYAPDAEAYYRDRGVYFTIEETPFLLAENREDMEHAFAVFDETAYRQKVAVFRQRMGYRENGGASKAVADRIMEEAGVGGG